MSFYKISFSSNDCCIFRAGFGCCALQTLIEICFFKFFLHEKCKIGEKARKWGKQMCFLNLHPKAGRVDFLLNVRSSYLHLSWHRSKTQYVQQCKNHEKSLFQPAIRVHSTQTLVKIYNTSFFGFFYFKSFVKPINPTSRKFEKRSWEDIFIFS